MTRTCLVHIYGTSNILAALSAVTWHTKISNRKDRVRVITIINIPGLTAEVLNDITRNIQEIIAPFGWSSPLILTDQQMCDIMQPYETNNNYHRTIRRFIKAINLNHVDEIYYAHIIGSQVPQLAMNAFPNAQRITFGDALGSIYDAELHLRLASGISVDSAKKIRLGVKTRIKLGIKKVIKLTLGLLFGFPRNFQATEALLIIPMDQTGECLKEMKLVVVPKKHVLGLIEQCEKSFGRLSHYEDQLLSHSHGQSALILLENISDGNFISQENELTVYEELIRKTVPKHSTVFIKAHPLSIAPINDKLALRLKNDYSPFLISNEFSRVPIELWTSLVKKCQIISISYSCISLSFLFDLDIVYPFGVKIIEKYFPQKFWDSYRNADQLYRGQLEKLKNWDGNGVLWKGSN